jgi:hypothetical protein
MSTAYVSAELRRLVLIRAEGLCEYCLVHEEDTYFGCQIDHIVSEKHNGPTNASNLAYACLLCNIHKGSDVGGFVPGTKNLVRFFNPRLDNWNEHFVLDREGVVILPLTAVAKATAFILRFNDEERLTERANLLGLGRYPTPAAQRRME